MADTHDWVEGRDLPHLAQRALKFLGNFGPTVRLDFFKGYMWDDDSQDGASGNKVYLTAEDCEKLGTGLLLASLWLKAAQLEAEKNEKSRDREVSK